MNTILIPEQLRKVVGGDHVLFLNITNIEDLIEQLISRYPTIRGRLINEETGNFNKFINVYVNGDDIRFLDSLKTIVKDGDEISIVPSVAGG